MTRLKKKDGFSLVEVVIALTVILTVSVTALSIALSSVTAKIDVMNKTRAQGFAADAVECFKAVELTAEESAIKERFASLFSFATGMTPDNPEEGEGAEGTEENNGAGEESDPNAPTYTYTSENSFTAEIWLSFENAEEGAHTRPTIEIVVTDNEGEEIISITYARGAGV